MSIGAIRRCAGSWRCSRRTCRPSRARRARPPSRDANLGWSLAGRAASRAELGQRGLELGEVATGQPCTPSAGDDLPQRGMNGLRGAPGPQDFGGVAKKIPVEIERRVVFGINWLPYGLACVEQSSSRISVKPFHACSRIVFRAAGDIASATTQGPTAPLIRDERISQVLFMKSSRYARPAPLRSSVPTHPASGAAE